MLVLSRKVGEQIQLGDQITVTLVKINGNIVRLGIDAPANMSIVRQELAHRQSSAIDRPQEAAESA